MKKDLNWWQLILFGVLALVLAQFLSDISRILAIAFQLGGDIAIIVGIIKGLVSLFRRKKPDTKPNKQDSI